MNPRFVKIQDVKTRKWHYINVNHVSSVTETATPETAPHWDRGNTDDTYAIIRMADGSQYETDTFNINQLMQRLMKESTEWSRVIDKLDLLAP